MTNKVNYRQVHDSSGLPINRVDLVGRTHGASRRPQVVGLQRHTSPSGEMFVRPSSQVRAATSGEIDAS